MLHFSLAAINPVCNSKHRLCTTLNLRCQRLCDEAASCLYKPSLKDFRYSNETWPFVIGAEGTCMQEGIAAVDGCDFITIFLSGMLKESHG